MLYRETHVLLDDFGRNDCGGGFGRQSPSLVRITAGNDFRASSWLHFSNRFLSAARLTVLK